MTLAYFIAILRHRIWIATGIFSIIVGLALLVSLLLPKIYTAEATLVIDNKGIDPVTGLNVPVQMLPGYMATQIDIIRSHNVAKKVVEKLKLADMREAVDQFQADTNDNAGDIKDWLADQLLKQLDIRPSRDSSVVGLEYEGVDPQFAAVLANAFAEAYIATNLELKTEPAKQYASWFEQQIKALRDNLEKAQARLTAFQQENGIVALDERMDVESARLTELARQMTIAQSQTVDMDARRSQLRPGDSTAKMESSPDVMNNSLIQKLKSDIIVVESRLAQATEKFGRRHPVYLQASAELDALKQKLGREMRSVRESLATGGQIAQKSEEELQLAFAQQKSRILDLNKLRDQSAVLTREIDHAQQAYMGALQRFNQTRMESQANQTNVAILNPAIPPTRPSQPRILRNLALAIFAGGVFGLFGAFLIEMFDRRVRSADDLVRLLDLNILGYLPEPAGAA